MRMIFDRKFTKQREKAPEKIRLAFDEFNSLLDNHALKGEWAGYRSINVTGNWRAIFSKVENTVWFVALGTHPQLYG